MNIIIDNIIFSLQKAGGVSVVWFELLKRMISDPELKLKIISRAEAETNMFKVKLNYDFSMLDTFSNKLPLQIDRFLSPIMKNEKGIFHSSYYRFSKQPNLINVTTVHDFTYEYYRNGMPKFIHRTQKGLAIMNSKKIICISENTKKDLLKFHPKINEDNIKVIYNGVNSEYKKLENSNVFISELVKFESGSYILYVGDRKSIHKNFRLVVSSCKNTCLPLVIAGGGLLSLKESEYLTSHLGESNYEHLHNIDSSKLNVIYNNAFALLYPSIYEGFGIPILEAQSAGCPVITSNLSSMPEVAGKGALLLENLSLENIVEKINHIKSNTYILNQLIIEGFENSSKFTWDKCYLETKSLYKDIQQQYF